MNLAAGDTVTWQWIGGTHSVIEDETNLVWCSVRTAPTDNCVRGFPTEGTFFYHCGVHPSLMKATVVVGVPPSLTVSTPAAGASVAGTFSVAGTASHSSGIARVDVRVDLGSWQQAAGTTSWSLDVDSVPLVNGLHTLRARATATSGATAYASVSVNVANPSTWELRFASISGATGTAGTTSVSFTVANDGNTAATNAAARLEYQYKGTWTVFASDTYTASAHSTVARTKTWSNLLLVGSFPVRVTLDPSNAFAELDESNNVGATNAAFWTNSAPGTDLGNP